MRVIEFLPQALTEGDKAPTELPHLVNFMSCLVNTTFHFIKTYVFSNMYHSF